MTRALAPFFSVLLLGLAATGCAGTPERDPPAGQLQLLTPLEIPSGAATVRLQHGRVTAFNAVQEQDPFCVFEIDTVSERPQPLEPASFPITRVFRSVETFAGMPVLNLRVAFERDERPSHIYYKTTFRLAPNPQKARSLTCMSNQQMPGVTIMRHLTLAEMREALGGHFALEANGAR
ncbi:MAG: hypothetical protein AB1831_01385 [Pseudomonadota bacterium]